MNSAFPFADMSTVVNTLTAELFVERVHTAGFLGYVSPTSRLCSCARPSSDLPILSRREATRGFSCA